MDKSTLSAYIREILKEKKVKEGTCGYDRDAKTGKKFSTPGGMPLKRKTIGEDDIKFSKGEMDKLHKDGKLKKGKHSFKYKLNDLEEEFLTPNEEGDEAVEKESASGAFEESVNEDYESDRIEKFTSHFQTFKLPPGYTIWLDSAYGAGSKVEVLRKEGYDEGVIIADPYGPLHQQKIQLHTTTSGNQIANKEGYDTLDKAMFDAVKYLDTLKESINEAKTGEKEYISNFNKLFGLYTKDKFGINNKFQDSKTILKHIMSGRQYYYVDMAGKFTGGKPVLLKKIDQYRSIYVFEMIDPKTLKRVGNKTIDIQRGNLGFLQVALMYSSHPQYELVNEGFGSINESLPSNIKDFAQDRGVLPLVKQINRWAKKLGMRVGGGDAIGKNYSTLILDLTYQGGEVRINTETDEINVKGKKVWDFVSFKEALGESVNEGLSPETTAKAEQIKSTMIGKNRDKLFRKYGKDAEKVAHGRAINQAKKASEKDEVKEVYSEKQRKWACAQKSPKFDEMCKDTAISKKKKMEENRLSELVKDALKRPIKEDEFDEPSEFDKPVWYDPIADEAMRRLQQHHKWKDYELSGLGPGDSETYMDMAIWNSKTKDTTEYSFKVYFDENEKIHKIEPMGEVDIHDLLEDNDTVIEEKLSDKEVKTLQVLVKDSNTKLSTIERKILKKIIKSQAEWNEPVTEDKDWIQKAIKRPGALHKKLGVPKGKKIPKGLINKTLAGLKKKDKDDKEKGTQLPAGDERELRQLNLAKTLSKFNEGKLAKRVFEKLRK